MPTSMVTTGTRIKCHNREISVHKELPKGRYMIDSGKKHVESKSWKEASGQLKKLGCKNSQIDDIADDLGTYYMSE